ncbi:MAG: thrombospondin type 3 repeat-containing protein [Deltaproteobacteria bacterium]|nr:thrombospondin type 3 repeat-containing protein [Deltaproteobacteria bacterium]
MATYGDICDGQGCQVYTCATPPSELAKKAVKDTSGIYLAYANMLTYGFYVDGDPKTKGPSCIGSASYKNEKWVTYNEGLTGKNVEQTPLGYIGPPGFGQNRGCMSQWGARCLEKAGEDYVDILRFYYGADIQLLQATGPCITSGQLDADDDGVLDADDNCAGVANASQSDTDGDTEGDACDPDDDNDGIADEKDNCPTKANPAQFDADKDGTGDDCEGDPGQPGGPDADLDGTPDANDLCPTIPSKSGKDSDNDGLGDECDSDLDGDGVSNILDDCPTIPDPAQDLGDCSSGFGFDGSGRVQASASCSLTTERAGTPRRGRVLLLAFAAVLLRRRRMR